MKKEWERKNFSRGIRMKQSIKEKVVYLCKGRSWNIWFEDAVNHLYKKEMGENKNDKN